MTKKLETFDDFCDLVEQLPPKDPDAVYRKVFNEYHHGPTDVFVRVKALHWKNEPFWELTCEEHTVGHTEHGWYLTDPRGDLVIEDTVDPDVFRAHEYWARAELLPPEEELLDRIRIENRHREEP